MSFFDDAFSSAKDFGSAVSRRTGQFVDVTRLKVTAADIKSDLNNRYRALGKAVYEARRSGASIDSIVEKGSADIDALIERLNEVQRSIAELQDKTLCPSCGASVPRSSAYCSRCGSPVERERRGSRRREEEAPAPEVVFADEE